MQVASASSTIAAQAADSFQGFWLGVAVMVLLIAALVYAIGATLLSARGTSIGLGSWAWMAVPILSLVGLGVAAYLTFIETQNVEAICGPVGDCNAVQASPYAKLFGLIPVGLIGLAGYLLVLGAWALARFGSGTLARLAPLAVFAMALFGVLFSIYLTYLELSVIRAVCAWCLTSAVLMALILIFATGPALMALAAEES